MKGNDCRFTAGQMFALYQALGTGMPKSQEELEDRFFLRRTLRFSDEEKARIGYREDAGANGAAIQISDATVTLERHLSPSQRRKIIGLVQAAALGYSVGYNEQWIVPALRELGDERWAKLVYGSNDDAGAEPDTE